MRRDRLRMVALIAGVACDSPVAAYTRGLATGDCAGIQDDALAEDCHVQAADCDGLSGASSDECWFRHAEKTDDPADCGRAGSFADDCRMHLFTRAIEDIRAEVGGDESPVGEAALAAGLEPDDIRPWSAWYRTALSRQRPLDRSRCALVSEPSHREACEKTGLALYADRLNRARDQHTWPCHGEELPAALRYSVDPDIDAMIARRTDLCP